MSATPPLIEAITRSLHHLAARQRVIAGNVANNDTPHYQAQEIAAPDFSALLAEQLEGSRAVRVSHPAIAASARMLALGATPPRDTRITRDEEVSETKPDGNNVSLEDQLLKLGQVQADYAALTSIYRKQLALLNEAIGH
ncbi:flagellar biosynthesis protein FlgB [Sphingomonas sp. RHCKR7]|uniref:flagellar biosynthesis protein FlgB n=1 Tax=Sphingomonas folli TaxID=2862497 RepID=UPI001CA5EF24|nr:flagellar biosynthesis protein FlgB [Sphingomonas folli]MBW6525534.1 flagellar biosynthesis protein FlgB [Sphingomonas folli]